MSEKVSIKICEEALDLAECYRFVADANAGAIHIFVGTVRNSHREKKVTHLDFEAYTSMAIREMKRIVDVASERWPCQRIAFHHRVGKTAVSEVPVIVALSTPHRQQGFRACEFVIDQLKKTVPIWKTEYYEDHPPYTQDRP